LSKKAGLDKYRIQALMNVIESRSLSKPQYYAAVQTLQEKSSVYAAGCRKRGRGDEARYYEKLAESAVHGA
jgi:hypothetical protein